MSAHPKYATYISTDLRRFMAAGFVDITHKIMLLGYDPECFDNIVNAICYGGYIRLAKWWLKLYHLNYMRILILAVKRSNLRMVQLIVNFTRGTTIFDSEDTKWLWINVLQVGDIGIFRCLLRSAAGYHFEMQLSPWCDHYAFARALANSLNPNMVTGVLNYFNYKGSISVLVLFARYANANNWERHLKYIKNIDEFWDVTASQALINNPDLSVVRMGLELLTKSRNYYQSGTASAMSRSLGSELSYNDEAKLAILREFDLLDYDAYTNARETMIELNRDAVAYRPQ